MSNLRDTIKLDSQAWDLIIRALEERDTSESLELIEEIKTKRKITALERRYMAYVEGEDGVLECDDDAIVSEGDDPGAYVQTWCWVPNSRAGIFMEGDKVLVTPTSGPASGHEFEGTVTELREEKGKLIYVVTDMDGDAFELDAEELTAIDDE
jgi:hypothetical protein